MWQFLLYALLIWFLYNLIFRLIIPVYLASRQVKKKFREMHERMQEEQVRQSEFDAQFTNPKSSSPSHGGDYIDFEEVK